MAYTMKSALDEQLTSLAPAVVRWGVAMVFLWFGFSQVQDVQAWVPDWAVSLTGLDVQTIVKANGIFEMIFGTLLLLGVGTRWVALVLALHMAEVTYEVGYNSIGVRDFGIAVAALSVALHGEDKYSLWK